MSEELLQTKSESIGRYLLYKLGATNLGQLKKNNIINSKFDKDIVGKKPDGIIVLPGGDVKAIIEYKQPSELNSQKKVDKAIKQEIVVAKQLCKLLIVTSGKKSYWINALSGKPVLDEHGKELKTIFDIKPIIEGKLSNEELSRIESLIDKIDHSLTDKINKISPPVVLDPSTLARTVWQKIWINTGKEPEKCLYNVVELFVFKFLSDVGVLKSHNNFQYVYSLSKTDSSGALKHYAKICRQEIRDRFPAGDDGTTIINGTIFVNEKGEPNLAQSYLFKEVLESLQDYDSKFGSFKYIRKEFKTRLYESFLRQQAGIRFLGQYFTPRNVVQAMIGMSNVKELKKGARICDPFCGVGGFILEAIAETPHLLREFEPKNGKVEPQITLIGYDKGSDEKDDERTIILAKANMLIYFSDLLVKYNSPQHLKAFSNGAFNKVFNLLRSNLGSFERTSEEPFDLILTNPPYVTSGSSSLKRAIDNAGLSSYYTAGGRGTESLAIEWIIRNLKENGLALIVVPDGLMNQSVILNLIKEQCFIQALISLPTRTFYSTPKKTYILIIEKKSKFDTEQDKPVFTYLVSEIGETRDAKRFVSEKNDLIEATSLFNQFKGSPTTFKTKSPRCKIIKFGSFNKMSNWMVDRWWTDSEKLALGINEANSEVSENEFIDLANSSFETIQKELKQFEKVGKVTYKTKTVQLKDSSLFKMEIGERVLKKDLVKEGVPVYSANVNSSFGFIKKSNLSDFSKPSLLWGIDGIFDWGYVEETLKFASTDHCGRLTVLHKKLNPKYIYYTLKGTKERYGFDRTYRASLANMKEIVSVDVPVDDDGEFDVNAQKEIADRYEKFEKLKESLVEQLQSLSSTQIMI